MNDAVVIVQNDPVLDVQLNRPEKLNAFNADLVEGLHNAVDTATRQGMRAVVFRGMGKGFSGGFDLSTLHAESDADLLHRFVRVEQLLQAVAHAPFATIAFVHGPCYGAAADLVAACQTRIAAPDARFRMPGTLFGLILGISRLSALVGSDAARLLVQRPKPFGAQDALKMGFLTGISVAEDWSAHLENRMSEVLAFDADTFAQMSDCQRVDTRAVDLQSLVQSVTSSSIKLRLETYISSLK